jgi:hypothetical protein
LKVGILFLVLLFLTLLKHAFPASGPHRHTLAEWHRICFFPGFRGWVANPPAMLPATQCAVRNLGFPFD